MFPLSNWTEADVWDYIARENIPVVPLYFAKPRPVVRRDGALIMVDDDRMKLLPGEVVEQKMVRFRTLGCYPLTGAIESTAATLDDDHRGNAREPLVRAAGALDRPRRRDLDGTKETRRIFLNARRTRANAGDDLAIVPRPKSRCCDSSPAVRSTTANRR